MGYDIELVDENGIVKVPSHKEGSTIVVGGNTQASINLTYNYSKFYYEHIDKEQGLKWIHNKKAKDTIDRLGKAVKALGVEFSGDYWEATPGNAGSALMVLLTWGYLNPEAVWEVN